MRKALSLSSVLIVGLVRNCASTIENEVQKINIAFSEAKITRWLIVESDSDDQSIHFLQKLSDDENFEFISLGDLRNKFPKRTERIAECRNRYLEELRTNEKYRDIDYFVVADLDGINLELTPSSVRSCWELDVDWDACFANQSTAYYDIWALRHNEWCPNDCGETYDFLVNHGQKKFVALNAAVYSRMLHIEKTHAPIEVDSAFGGMAIYKRSTLFHGTYFGLDENGREVCEHVSLHRAMRDKHLKLYIVPSLINSSWNEHSIRSTLVHQIKARLRGLVVDILQFFISKKRLKLLLAKKYW